MWITYSAILCDKLTKSLVPGLSKTTEKLLSDILNVSNYLPHTETFFLNKRLYTLLTCWLTHCKKRLTALSVYNSFQETSPNITTPKLKI